MLRQIFIIASLVLAMQCALAAEAGKVIFVAGAAHADNQELVLGASVQEGGLLTTGADGYVYIKTIDNGLFILRPNTKARIATYYVDQVNPSNTRIKLELLSGVARSKSGEAVKLARQNFRFNTPVAAIGVRGTDFTVFTDQDTSRVAVISGGVIVSGFAGGCRPEGSGPCEGSASRELSAGQKGQLLQIKRGQAEPQLMPGGTLAPDLIAPPRSDEPGGKSAASNNTNTNAPSLDTQKTASLVKATEVVPVKPVPVPPVVEVTPPSPPVVQLPERQIVWGRWQPILDQPAKVDFVNESDKGSELVAVKGYFALFSTPGQNYVSADHGSVGFALKDGEAYIFNDGSAAPAAFAKLENGKLNVNFDNKTFATSLDIVNGTSTFKTQAQGVVTANGHLYGDASNARISYLDVDGILSSEKGGSAAYVFTGRLDARSTVNGATYWGH